MGFLKYNSHIALNGIDISLQFTGGVLNSLKCNNIRVLFLEFSFGRKLST